VAAGGAATVRGGAAAAAQEEWRMTAEVVLGLCLEWFWEHKIHGQNTEKNVWKMEDDEFSLLFKKQEKNKMS